MKLFKNKPDYRKIACGIGIILSTVIILMIDSLLVWFCLELSSTVINLIPAISGYIVAGGMTTIEMMLSVIALCAVCFICIIGFVLPFVLIYIGLKLANIINNSFSYDEPKKIEDPLFEDD